MAAPSDMQWLRTAHKPSQEQGGAAWPILWFPLSQKEE